MLIMYFNAEIQIVSLVNFTLLSQRSFVPSLASVTKSAVVGHFFSLREPTTSNLCENVLNQVTQKMMAHVTLSLSPSYNLKADSCWIGNVYQLIYTSAHHLEQYLQISK